MDDRPCDTESDMTDQLTHCLLSASLVTQMVKNLPAMQETWVRSLGLENSLGEENGYPFLQAFVPGASKDRGVHGVAESRT